MKKTALAMTVTLLALPAVTFAGGWKHGHGPHRHGHRGRHVTIIKERHHYDGGAIAAGVLGGLLTGVIIDRVLLPPRSPQVIYTPPPAYHPPVAPAPPASRDPYDRGYQEGYSQGYEKGYREYYEDRFERGLKRGYEEGYDAGRTGETSGGSYTSPFRSRAATRASF